MSELKHTPGPWGISGSRLDIRANNHGAKFIASVYQPKTHELAPMDVEALANARLITAAPDLLEALEAVEAWWFNGETDANVHIPNQLADMIQAAITKANGLSK